MGKNVKSRLADDLRASMDELHDVVIGKPTKVIVHKVTPGDSDAREARHGEECMKTIDRITFWTCDGLGYLLCELAFKTGCRGPFALAYRAGCWLYGKADEPGIRSGELVANPAFHRGGDEPMYLRRRDSI